MANEVFGDEESTNASVVKEFERFGTDVGMWGNEDPNIPTESGYVKSVNKKYVFETLENEGKLFDELELKKKVVVGEVVKGESKVVEGDIKSEESGSESSIRRKRNMNTWKKSHANEMLDIADEIPLTKTIILSITIAIKRVTRSKGKNQEKCASCIFRIEIILNIKT